MATSARRPLAVARGGSSTLTWSPTEPRSCVRQPLKAVCRPEAHWALRLERACRGDRSARRHSSLHPGTAAEGPRQTADRVPSPDFAGPTLLPASQRDPPASRYPLLLLHQVLHLPAPRLVVVGFLPLLVSRAG